MSRPILNLARLTLVAAVLASAPHEALAQPAAGFSWHVSASAGFFQPSSPVVSDLYGRGLPVTIQADGRITDRLGMFAGVRFARDTGRTVVVGQQIEEERYRITLRTDAARLGATYYVSRGRSSLALGGGLVVGWYVERWPDAGFVGRGSAPGALASAGFSRLLTGRVTVTGRVEYTYLPVDRTALRSVGLGGLDVTAGIGVSFGRRGPPATGT